MTKLYAENLLTKEQLQAIGHVAIESARLDSMLDRMICFICGLGDASGKALVEERDLTPKLQIFRQLVIERLRNRKVRDKFESLYARHAGAIHERNAFVHGKWFGIVSSERPPLAQVVHNKTKLHGDKAIATALSLANFQHELEAFFLLYGHKLSTSPRRYR